MTIHEYPEIKSDGMALVQAIITQEVKPRVTLIAETESAVQKMNDYAAQVAILENSKRELQRWNDTKRAAERALKAYGENPDFSEALAAQAEQTEAKNLLSRALSFVQSLAKQAQGPDNPEAGMVAEWAAKGLMSMSPTKTANGSTGQTARDRERSAQIRTWAKSQPQFAGQLNDRGRIPEHIVTAYDALH
jgi:hypothetical protein